MPIRRGHLAPVNTFIDTVIKKFDGFPGRNFVIGNALVEGCPIIYCNTSFCELTGFDRHELVQRECVCDFLNGPETNGLAKEYLKSALIENEERHIETYYYKKDGEKFYCSVIAAPLKNEQGVVIMYIVNHEEIKEASYSDDEEIETKRRTPQRKISTMLRSSFRRKTSSRKHSTMIKESSDENIKLINSPVHNAVSNADINAVNGNVSNRCSPIIDVNLNEENTLNKETTLSEENTLNNEITLGKENTLNNENSNENTLSNENSKENTLNNENTLSKDDTLSSTFSDNNEQDIANYKIFNDATSFNYNNIDAYNDKNTNSNRHSYNDRSINFNKSAETSSLMSHKTLEKVCSTSLSDLRSTGELEDLVLPTIDKQHLSVSDTTMSRNNYHSLYDTIAKVNSYNRSTSKFDLKPPPSNIIPTNVPPTTMPASTARPHKVAQVMSLGSDVLPEYKVESPKIHPWTILHYSPFKAIWDWVVLFLVMYTAIITPYMAAFVLTREANKKGRGTATTINIEDDPLVIVDYIVDVMFIIDIFINFRTTFVDCNDEVVSDPCRVAVNYMKGWFMVDLLAAIPFELLIMIGNTDQTTTLIGLLKTARLLRLVRVARKLDRYSEYGTALLMLLMFGFALVAHWLACVWYAIGNFEQPHENSLGWLTQLGESTNMPYNDSILDSGPDLQTKYLTALYFTLSSLTSVGFGNVSANTNAEKIFTILIMFMGALMHAIIFGNVTAIIQRLYSGMAHYHATMRKVREFIRFYQIPSPLRQRLEDYSQYDYSYTNGIDMNEVLRNFPEGLQADICLHLNRQLLSSSQAFRNCSPGCLRALSLKLCTTHCPPGDYIIHNGDEISTLYWIGRGTVEIIQSDTIIAILGKGDSFGENFGLQANCATGKSRASVRALTYCDLHSISRDNLLYIMRAYPEFQKQFNDEMQITYDLRDAGNHGMDVINLTNSAETTRTQMRKMSMRSEDIKLEDRFRSRLHSVNESGETPTKTLPHKRKSRTYSCDSATNSTSLCNCTHIIKKDMDDIRNQIYNVEQTLKEDIKSILDILRTKTNNNSEVLYDTNFTEKDSIETDGLMQYSTM